MARLVTEFKYLKPDDKLSPSAYAKYIATREGVDKINEFLKLKSATVNRKQLIAKALRAKQNSRHGFGIHYTHDGRKCIADDEIQATRPRAERFGTYDLFTNDGVSVNLSTVSEELKLHKGNVWTVISSIRREDAKWLGFNIGE